jgi:thiosulfate/3-mercaptopyruvate sulfurtransferase
VRQAALWVTGALVLATGCRQRPDTAPAAVVSSGASRAALGAPNARAANAAPMLVNTAWLAEHVNDRNLVVLHVGTRAQYDSGHVAGSRHVTLDHVARPQRQGELSLQMADSAQLVAWLQRMGIDDEARVVVVPHDSVLQSSTRVYFTLTYLGVGDRASLLDGGFPAWRREGRAVSTAEPAPAAAVRVTPRLRPELIAQVAQVETATQDQSRSIVDARLTRFFNGDGGGYPRPGHIPGAVNIPISSVSTNGYFRPRAELEALFAAQQVGTGKPVITYCHIGQQATLLWFVATLLDRDARMYDGSFQEWSGSTRPVVGPGGARTP